MSEHDPYTVYVRAFGKIASGAKLGEADFGECTAKGFVKYGPEAQMAVSPGRAGRQDYRRDASEGRL